MVTHYNPINDYALLGNGRTALLVSKKGSIDWLCWPRFDSPSIFGALLDCISGGYWSIQPTGIKSIRRQYHTDSNVLDTIFTTCSGTCVLTDCMPIYSQKYIDTVFIPEQDIIRKLACTEGTVQFTMTLDPAPEYGKGHYSIEKRPYGFYINCKRFSLLFRSNNEIVVRGKKLFLNTTLFQAETAYFSLSFAAEGPGSLFPLEQYSSTLIDHCDTLWRSWVSQINYNGPYSIQVKRSALVLKALTYAPSGAIVAAPTSSLPERLHGDQNWDYRYCWLRDSALTVRALYELGFTDEAKGFVTWLLHTTRLTRPKLQVLYDIYGGVSNREYSAHWLEGYERSNPVRIGNAAAKQFQLDIYGEVISAVTQIISKKEDTDSETRSMLDGFGCFICKNWNQPDEGIWEPRSGRYQHTHSQVLCWSGLDRLIQLQNAKILCTKQHELYVKTIGMISGSIRQQGWDENNHTYLQRFGHPFLDMNTLLMAWYGFETSNCSRMQSTFNALHNRLHAGSGQYYRNDQSKNIKEGSFGICNFWVAEFLAKGGGTLQQAMNQFELASRSANDLNLFSEETDPSTGAALGNYPQAFTHIGLINAALSIYERIRQEKS